MAESTYFRSILKVSKKAWSEQLFLHKIKLVGKKRTFYLRECAGTGRNRKKKEIRRNAYLSSLTRSQKLTKRILRILKMSSKKAKQQRRQQSLSIHRKRYIKTYHPNRFTRLMKTSRHKRKHSFRNGLKCENQREKQ